MNKPSPQLSPAAGFEFRPLAASDLHLLHQWLLRPHVAQWWPESSTPEELAEDYLLPAAEASGTKAHIALLDGEPVGFIQSYVAMDSGGGWWEEETDPGVRGIDQFIADPGRLGQGLGSAMVRAFAARLFSDPEVTRLQADPDPRNARAIRAYEKAGFHPVREIATPDGAALLMVCERALTT